MKKHAVALASLSSENLTQAANTLRSDIAALHKGIRMGDVQNYKQLAAKRKELARVLTRANQERKAK